MDSGNQTPADQVKFNDTHSTFVTVSASADGGVPLLEPGEVVGEKYKIIKLLGHGGMGSVYQVEQIFFRQLFALKTLTGQNFPDVAIRRFQKEAQAASKLNHPNLVRAYDFGILGTHQPFFVMDLIEGENLSEYSKRVGTLSIEEVLRIFIPVCFALGYAHSEGIVHRDIKPGNIMLDKSSGENETYIPKVVDFGIAKLTDDEGGNSVNLTRTGEIFGTPLYMSPEQCMGTKIDHRTDIYSIGCVMYEALTGAPPFHGDNALNLMLKHQSETPPTLKEASMGREFPEALEQIVAKTLAKNPDERYQSLIDLSEDLAILQRGQTDETANITVSKTVPHFLRTSPTTEKSFPKALIITVALACLAVGFGLGALVGFVLMPKPKPVVVEKYVQRAVDMNTLHDDLNDLGSTPIVTVQGKGPTAIRLYKFPKAFSIGMFATIDSKTGKASERQEARGTHVIPFDHTVFFLVRKTDLDKYPQLLKGFGDYDVNFLEIQNDNRKGDMVAHNPDVVFDAALAYCATWKALVNLAAYDTALSDVGLRCLQDVPYLLNLEITNTRCTADAFRNLKNFPNLADAGIGAMKDGKTLLPALSKSKILHTINMAKLDLTDKDVIQFANVKTLVQVNLQENFKITNASIEALKDLPELKALHTAGTAITPAAIPALAAMNKLNAISIDRKYWTAKDAQRLQTIFPKALIVGCYYDEDRKELQTWEWKKEL
ncbi:MAG: hypothetical protein C0469_12555 [Cyanobacteria bacterium DS2.3.42]|nr:hypothetical protein [Cyanobacteria bacterium DS2.3.42]